MNAHSTFTTIIIHICKQLFLKALPNNISNSRGNSTKIMDFLYPVGNATNVSFPETKVLKVSNCLGLNGLNSICQHTSETAMLKSTERSILKRLVRVHLIEPLNHFKLAQQT